MDISDFNRKLSNFIADARALEKTDRKRANAMWLKICEFAIEYSKQKNVDRSLRLRIWQQVDVILQKVKGEESPTSKDAGSQLSISKEKSVPFEVDFGFDFPSVPKDEEIEESEGVDKIPFQSPPPPENAGTSDDEETQLFQDAVSSTTVKEPVTDNQNDFLERIRKMEEELRKMPDIFKEIRPSEYTPDKSIIPSSAPPPKISPEYPSEPITTLDQGASLKIEPVERPDTIDPYKGTKQKVEIKDPFGPSAQDNAEKEEDTSGVSKLHCYACGAPIKEKDTICPKCGAEL